LVYVVYELQIVEGPGLAPWREGAASFIVLAFRFAAVLESSDFLLVFGDLDLLETILSLKRANSSEVMNSEHL